MTVTVTKIVSHARAEEYVRLGRWGIVSASNEGAIIRWSGGEHERPPEPECAWDRMWRQPFDRPELVAGNGSWASCNSPMPVLRDDSEEHKTVPVIPEC